MITEKQAATLMTEANPVPDLDSYNVADLGVAAYLSDLEQRSSAMTRLDTKQNDHREKKRIGTWWLVAAAAIILTGVAVVFINQGDDAPVAGQPTDPADTIEAYMDAYNAGDIDGVMGFFSEESVVIGHPFAAESRGLEEIRTIQTEDVKLGVGYTISNLEVTGDTVTWDHAWGGQFCVEGNLAVVQDGTILSWTWPDNRFTCPQPSE